VAHSVRSGLRLAVRCEPVGGLAVTGCPGLVGHCSGIGSRGVASPLDDVLDLPAGGGIARRGERVPRRVGLHRLLVGDFLPECGHDRRAVQVLHAVAGGRERDVVDAPDLGEFLEDEVAAPVAVEQHRRRALRGESCHRVRDVRPLDRDGVFDAEAQQPADVRATLDDDDGVAVGHSRARRHALELGDVLDAGLLAHRLDEVLAGHRRVLEVGQQVRRPVDEFATLRCACVLDGRHCAVCSTRADAFDRFEGGSQDRRLDPVEAAPDGDRPERAAVLRLDVDVYPADLRGFLQAAQIEFVAEQPLGLPENGADDVTPLDHPARADLRVNEVLR
jgi:hypothetical protein